MTQSTINHVFIVGVPRSGTTLMRDLLSRHPQVAMPQDEFQLIPFLLERYGYTATLDETDIDRYLAVLKRSAFYHHRKTNTPIDSWRPAPSPVPEIISETLRYFAPKETSSDLRYIGDKSPNNLFHLNAIFTAFSGCKIIHVVRDPRDVALSSRKAWKKSLTRGAHQWHQGVTTANDFSQKHPESIFTVRYEDLLSNTSTELSHICDFLNLPFDESLLELRESREKMGDAAGFRGLKTDNTRKFEQDLSERDLARLTSYIYDEMVTLGYDCPKPANPRKFDRLELGILSLYVLIGSTLRHARDKGLINGIRYRLAQILLR